VTFTVVSAAPFHSDPDFSLPEDFLYIRFKKKQALSSLLAHHESFALDDA
jgi:hypothetical protein